MKELNVQQNSSDEGSSEMHSDICRNILSAKWKNDTTKVIVLKFEKSNPSSPPGWNNENNK